MNAKTRALLEAADFQFSEPLERESLMLLGFGDWLDAKGASQTEIVLSVRRLQEHLQKPNSRPAVSLVTNAKSYGISLAFPGETNRIYVPKLDSWKPADPRPISIDTLDVGRLAEVLQGS